MLCWVSASEFVTSLSVSRLLSFHLAVVVDTGQVRSIGNLSKESTNTHQCSRGRPGLPGLHSRWTTGRD